MRITIDRADKNFALWIKYRDNWTCKRCFKKYPVGYRYLQNSHFKGRAKENTRFMPENCDSLCFGCHRYFTANPMEHAQWQFETKGEKVVNDVIFASHLYKKKDRVAEELYWAQKLKTDFDIVV